MGTQVIRTALITTSYADDDLYLERARLWAMYYWRRWDFDTIAFDDGSSQARCHILGLTNQPPDHRLQVIRFPVHCGRPSDLDYAYAWRAVYAIKALFELFEYDRVIYCETDFAIISERMWAWVESLSEGWSTIMSPGPFFAAESALHVVCRGTQAFDEFAASGRFRERVGGMIELGLPFTNVNTEMVGNRSDLVEAKGVPPGWDYVAQMRLNDLRELVFATGVKV